MTRFLPLALVRCAFFILMLAVASAGAVHRVNTQDASTAEYLALSGLTVADICGDGPEKASAQDCQACIFANGLGLPPHTGVPLSPPETHLGKPCAVHALHIAAQPKFHPARAPPTGPFA